MILSYIIGKNKANPLPPTSKNIQKKKPHENGPHRDISRRANAYLPTVTVMDLPCPT